MTTAEGVFHLGRDDSVGLADPCTPPASEGSELRFLLIPSATAPSEHIQDLLRDEFPDGDVAVATNLDGALARLAESDYDLVLVDLSLPDAEGEAILRAVRNASPQTKLMALTGRADGTLATWIPAGGPRGDLVNGEQDGPHLAEAVRHTVRDGHTERVAHDHLVAALRLESEAAQRLREIDVAKSDLVGIASHEIRTPLTVIAIYAEMLREEEGLTARQTDSIDAILRNASRLATLTDELTMLSNLNSARVQMEMSAVDLGALVRSARTALQTLWTSKQLDVRLHLPGEPVLVTGDAGHLERLVLNLITNAITFTDDAGTVTCRLSTTATDVVLAVIDTGRGIPAAEQAQLFTKFFRGSHLSERSVQGTGLGLHFAASISSNHRGQMWVDYLDGVGSTFNVRLPRRLPGAQGSDPMQPEPNATLGASLVSLLDLPGTDPEVGDITSMLQAALDAALQTGQWELVADAIYFAQGRLAVRGLSEARVNDFCSVVEAVGHRMSAADRDRLRGSLALGTAAAALSPSDLAPLGLIETTYLELLLQGDRTGAVALVRRCLSDGMEPTEVLLGILEPVQREVGRRWAQGRVSVIQEHFCTSVTQGAMRDLRPAIIDGGPSQGRVMAVHAPGSLHRVGLRMVVDVLQGQGWSTTYIEDDITVETLIELLTLHRPEVLLLSASMPGQIAHLRLLIEAVRHHPGARGVKVVVGGRPFRVAPELADAIGADASAPDARSASDVCTELLSGR